MSQSRPTNTGTIGSRLSYYPPIQTETPFTSADGDGISESDAATNASYSRKARTYQIEQLFRGKGLDVDKMAASVQMDTNSPKNGIATIYGPMDALALQRYGADTNRFVLVFSRKSGDIRVTYLMVEKAHWTILPRVFNTGWVKLRGVVGYRAVVCDNCVYIMGGRRQDSGYLINRVIRYDPLTEGWKTCQGMNHARANFAVSVIGRTKILVSGGEVDEDGNDSANCSTEMYDPHLNKWTVMPEMDLPLKDHACTDHEYDVFTCGGTKEMRKQGNKTFMVFHRQKPKDRAMDEIPFQWKDLTRQEGLPKRLSKHSMTRHGNVIYVIGGVARTRHRPDGEGHDSFKVEEESTDEEADDDVDESEEPKEPKPKVEQKLETSSGVYCYTLGRNKSLSRTSSGNEAALASGECWHTCPDMKRPRCDAGVVALGNRIYVIGGHDHNDPDQPITEVDCYHVVKEKWKSVFSLDERSYASVDCCTIDVPVTNTDFTFEAFTGTCKWVMW